MCRAGGVTLVTSDYQSQLALYASAIKTATAKQVSAVLLRI